MHGGIVIVIRLATDTAVDGKAVSGQAANPGKAGVRANKSQSAELIQPPQQPGIVEFRFVEKFIRLRRTAVAEQKLAGRSCHQGQIRPGAKPVAILFVQRAHGPLMREAAVEIVFLIGIIAAAVLAARLRPFAHGCQPRER